MRNFKESIGPTKHTQNFDNTKKKLKYIVTANIKDLTLMMSALYVYVSKSFFRPIIWSIKETSNIKKSCPCTTSPKVPQYDPIKI